MDTAGLHECCCGAPRKGQGSVSHLLACPRLRARASRQTKGSAPPPALCGWESGAGCSGIDSCRRCSCQGQSRPVVLEGSATLMHRALRTHRPTGICAVLRHVTGQAPTGGAGRGSRAGASARSEGGIPGSAAGPALACAPVAALRSGRALVRRGAPAPAVPDEVAGRGVARSGQACAPVAAVGSV